MKKYFLKLLFLIISLFFIASFAQCQNSQLDITLTWSTDTYVPAKYQGKALPVIGSNIEVAAIINTPGADPEKLVYNWFINEYFQVKESGLNKQVLKFSAISSTNKKNLIRLEIKDLNGSFLGASYISINLHHPEILIYAKKNLSSHIIGINKEYMTKSNQEITFIARPYFFNISDLDDLLFEWQFDGEELSKKNGNNLNSILLKINKLNETISRKLGITVENKNNYSQKGQKIIDVIINP